MTLKMANTVRVSPGACGCAVPHMYDTTNACDRSIIPTCNDVENALWLQVQVSVDLIVCNQHAVMYCLYHFFKRQQHI